jgi:hypothetical protein
MADLYHLLEELEENENGTGDKNDRRLTVETAATEAMSEDYREGGEDLEDGEDNSFAASGSRSGTPQIPLALQEAEQRRRLIDAFTEGDEDDAFDGLQGGKKKTSAYTGTGDNDVFGSSDQEQQEFHPPNEVFERLHHLWLQERYCPELLEYDDEMVTSLVGQFEERQEGIDQLLESSEAVELLMANLAQQDLDRAKFVLSDWLTVRLHKIEAHPLHMRDKVHHMSDKEIEYLQSYGSLMEHHLKVTVLDAIPQAWQALDEPNMIDQPDYEGYHFWLVKETIVDKDEIEHNENQCLVAKYCDMRENMREGKVELLI